MADSFVQLNNDGPGKKIDTRTENVNGDHRQVMVVGDPITNANVANVSAAGALQVDGSAITQPVSVTNTITTAPPSNASTNITQISGSAITEGQKAMAASLPVVIASDQSAVAIFAASLPLPSGASTSANQSTANTTLSSILTNTPGVGQTTMANSSPVVIASNQSSIPVTLTSTTVTGNVTVVQTTGTNLHTVVDSGTIALSGTSSISGTVTANQGAANTATNKWPVAIVDSGGVNVASVNATNELLVTDTDLTLSQASTTSGQLGPLIQGAVTTAAPTYTTAQTNPLSLTTAGALRTDASATIQPVSGTVTANQGTANATPWNDNIAQIAGTTTSIAAAGTQKVGISGATAATLDGVITAATSPVNGVAILTVAQTTAPSLTAGQSVAVQCDYQGSVFVKPYRRGQTASKATTIAASTTATTVLAAQAAGIFADISSLIITPTPGATATIFTCTLSDGTNSYIFDMDTGTTAGAAGFGVNATFNPPLPATTAATAWTVANSSATPTVHIVVVAVLQKAS